MRSAIVITTIFVCASLSNAQWDTVGFNSAYNYTTKTLQSYNQQCPNWQITDDPYPSTFEPRAATVCSTFGGWGMPIEKSRWIGTTETGGEIVNGLYRFETTFFISGNNIEPSIVLDFMADDSAEVFLNNVALATTKYGFEKTTHVVSSNGAYFRKGNNNLRVDVYNTSQIAMGMDISGYVVSRGVIADFFATEACAGDTVFFYDSSHKAMSSIARWQWDFGDGASSTLQNPKHIYNASGLYSVKFVVTDDSSSTDSVTKQIRVKTLPFVDAGPDTTYCGGNGVRIGGSPTGPPTASFIWSPSAGLNNTRFRNPIASPNQTTMYVVTVIDTSGCSSVDSVMVRVADPPVVYAGNDVLMCQGESVQLTASGGTTYRWSPILGLDNPGIPNPIASPSHTTAYVVTGTIANGCSNYDTVIVTVLPPITYTVAPTMVDLGVTNVDSTKKGKVVFTNTSAMGLRIRSAIFKNTTIESTVLNSFPVLVAESNTVYIEFTATPKSVGVFIDTVCIEIDSACPAKVCIPITIEGVSTCLTPDVTSVAGKRPGETMMIPIVVAPLTKFVTAKKIVVTVKYNSELLRLTDNPQPTVGSIMPVAQGNGEVSFIVTPDSMPTPNATIALLSMQALLAPYVNGKIEVTTSLFTLKSGEEIVGGNCGQEFSLDSSCIQPGSLRSHSSAEIEGIYPNPSYSNTTIAIVTKNNSHIRLGAYDVFGRLMEVLHDGEMSNGKHEVIINTEKYADGIYFCRMIHDGQITTRAFNVSR